VLAALAAELADDCALESALLALEVTELEALVAEFDPLEAADVGALVEEPPAPDATAPMEPPATAVFEGRVLPPRATFLAAEAKSDCVFPEGGFITPTIPLAQ
jgi:hypothetical protein